MTIGKDSGGFGSTLCYWIQNFLIPYFLFLISYFSIKHPASSIQHPRLTDAVGQAVSSFKAPISISTS